MTVVKMPYNWSEVRVPGIRQDEPDYDTIIIGSGFGGSMVAHALVNAGRRVVMVERGDWVRRGPHCWEPESTLDLSPWYATATAYRVSSGGYRERIGSCGCVGGPSVFCGAVSMRLREADFGSSPEIVCESGACWPCSYRDFEPYYCRAEQILRVAGESGHDPSEPERSAAYPESVIELSDVSRIVEKASLALDLYPFRLPLAISFAGTRESSGCIRCTSCDTFACAVGAKNDLETQVLSDLVGKGLELRANTVAVRLVTEGARVTAVKCLDVLTRELTSYRGRLVVLSAGALGSPHLILACGLGRRNPSGHVVGHYLMRHCAGIVYGFFRRRLAGHAEFHKQLGIHDFYFGHRTVRSPTGKLGNIQQVHAPPIALVTSRFPRFCGPTLERAARHTTGLLVLAEDQPRYCNHVAIDSRRLDRYSLPELLVSYSHSARDEAARRALVRIAKRILRKAGAVFFYVHKINTFSHAVGTVRMGIDPGSSPLDTYCRFRGVENLYVVDGSFMPTSGGVNPSLTIAANALRCADHMLGRLAG